MLSVAQIQNEEERMKSECLRKHHKRIKETSSIINFWQYAIQMKGIQMKVWKRTKNILALYYGTVTTAIKQS